jgi:signal transduction histidine kinase
MLMLTMTEQATHLQLAGAALGLLGHGATATELERRFVAAGARLEPAIAGALLNELLALGLVRVARREGDESLFVPTSLGVKALADGIGGVASVQLADLEALRSDLLSTIAHELRTPLTAVRTSIGLLTDAGSTPTDEQRRTLLETIERNADRMQRLIADILDLTRFRAGQIRLQLRGFDAANLARAVATSLTPVAVARGVSLVVDATESGPPVYGDHRRLEQALVNLVSNAIRFSPDGAQVTISVANGDGWARWRVEDVGPGISVEDQTRLFERFFVGRRDRQGSRDGIGLGLPTALAIAQAHGGAIEVESAVGVGSVFTLAVPADGPDEVE